MKTNKKRSRDNSDWMKRRDIRKTARLRFKLLMIYVPQSEVIYLTVDTVIEATTERAVVKVTGRIVFDLN